MKVVVYMKQVKTCKIMINIFLSWQHSRFHVNKEEFNKMAVMSCDRKIFKCSVAKLDSGKHKLVASTSNRILPVWEQSKLGYFILNLKGYGTEKVAMTTKF